MRTKKRKSVAFEVDSVKSESALPPASESQTPEIPSSEKPNRISFNVTPEGAPDWARMLPKTKEQLTSLLQNPDVHKELGFTKEEAKKIEEIGFGEDEANALLDLISGIDSFAASKIYSVPMEITRVAFAFTPEHRKKITPPMSRVLNKWGPMVLKTWKDEIGLGIVMLAVLNTQVQIMHILEEKRKRNLPAGASQNKVTPISEVPQSKPEEKPVVKSDDPLENVGFQIS